MILNAKWQIVSCWPEENNGLASCINQNINPMWCELRVCVNARQSTISIVRSLPNESSISFVNFTHRMPRIDVNGKNKRILNPPARCNMKPGHRFVITRNAMPVTRTISMAHNMICCGLNNNFNYIYLQSKEKHATEKWAKPTESEEMRSDLTVDSK